MDPVRNPFAPGAGTPPPELAGRKAIVEETRVALQRVKAGNSAQGVILTGLRGVGKTVLLVKAQDIAQENDYLTCMIEATETRAFLHLLIPQLRAALISLNEVEATRVHVHNALRALRSFIGALKVSYGEFEFTTQVAAEPGVADSGNLELDLSAVMLRVGEAARHAGRPICLLIDELQYLAQPELEALIVAYHKLAQHKLPLHVVGAGLPQIVNLAGEAKSYAERLFRYPRIGELDPEAAREAIVLPAQAKGVRFSAEAVRLILEKTERYPYFLQQWAHDSWNVAKGEAIGVEDVRAATEIAIKSLDESFFQTRFDRCTPSEQRYMRALALLGPGTHKSGDIARNLGVKTTSVAPVRSKLIAKGMIYSPAHGDAAFTVPMFDAYMRRTAP